MPNWLFAGVRARGSRAGHRAKSAPRQLGTSQSPRVEPLEHRQMMSVSQDASGFTVVTPEANDRVYYVSSSSGSDSNTGLSTSTPVKTLAKAKSLMRSNTGDQMLLKRGDTWHEAVGVWTKGGASSTDPMVLGAYGVGDRPVVATGTASAMSTGSSSAKVTNHFVIQGIKFYADARDPASSSFSGGYNGNEGLRLLASTNDLLVENVAVDGYTTNVTLSNYFGSVSNVRIRRSVITDAYNLQGHAQGLYAEHTDGLLLEENVFDHNGWDSRISGAKATMYNHNAYIKETVPNFVARGNVFSNASSHGLQARSGGIIEFNTFLNNPISLDFGIVNGSPVMAGGVTGRVTSNLFQGGGSLDGTFRGYGIQVSNIKPGGTTISGNVFSNLQPGGTAYAINLGYGTGITNESQAVGINDLMIENNVIYNWSRGIYINTSLIPNGTGNKAIRNVTIRNNQIQKTQSQTVMYVGSAFAAGVIHVGGNTYHSSAGAALINTGTQGSKFSTWGPVNDKTSVEKLLTYVDSSRTTGSYAATLGLTGTDAGLVAAIRGQSDTNWDADLTGTGVSSFVLSGFTLPLAAAKK